MRRAENIGGDDESGQASVEFALVLPVIALSAWLVAAVAAVSVRHLEVLHAARVAARVAALDASPDMVRAATGDATSLSPLEVEITTHDSLVTVSVRVRYPVPVPIPVRWRPTVMLSSQVTMAREQATGS